LVERSYGAFAADPGKSKASFKNGVLTVTLPKPPEAKTKAKKIAIR